MHFLIRTVVKELQKLGSRTSTRQWGYGLCMHTESVGVRFMLLPCCMAGYQTTHHARRDAQNPLAPTLLLGQNRCLPRQNSARQPNQATSFSNLHGYYWPSICNTILQIMQGNWRNKLPAHPHTQTHTHLMESLHWTSVESHIHNRNY